MVRAVIYDMYETLITHYNSPLYFGSQMAADAGISEESFQKLWRPTMGDRTTGKLSFEKALEMIFKENGCYSEELLNRVVTKRIAVKEDCFRHLHEEIVPMLKMLKEKGMKIGLISNCFSEEAQVIRRSILFPYFDAVYLSYEQGLQKPDEEIFRRCMAELDVNAEECVYVGDGGSYELETARKLGMNAVQAVWYLKEGTLQLSKPRTDFVQMKRPVDVVALAE